MGVAMRTALNGGGADRLKLLQEAATLCQFSHPNIVLLHGMSHTEDKVA